MDLLLSENAHQPVLDIDEIMVDLLNSSQEQPMSIQEMDSYILDLLEENNHDIPVQVCKSFMFFI